MVTASRRSLSRRGPRLRGAIPLLALVLIVAALAGSGFVRGTAAAPVSPPPGFEWDCVALGGEYIEIYDSSGNVTEYSCKWSDGKVTTCTSGGCSTTKARVEPVGRVVDPSDAVAVIEAAPTVTPGSSGGKVLTEDPPTPTAAPTEDPAAPRAPVETPTAPAGATPVAPSEAPADQAGAGQDSGATGEQSSGAPADASGPASLTLVTYICASGYDFFAPEADPTADCPDTSDGVRFSLEGIDTDGTRTSGDDSAGTAVFEDLDPGAYRLVGQPPTGMAVAFILDCTSNVRSFEDAPFSPIAIVGPYGTLALTLQPGEELTCAWYGVPAA